MSPQIECRMAQLKQADFVHHAEEARRATAASAAQSDAATSQPHPPRSAGQPTSALPVLYVLDGDRRSLDDLSGRFGRDFTVRGEPRRTARCGPSRRWRPRASVSRCYSSTTLRASA